MRLYITGQFINSSIHNHSYLGYTSTSLCKRRGSLNWSPKRTWDIDKPLGNEDIQRIVSDISTMNNEKKAGKFCIFCDQSIFSGV